MWKISVIAGLNVSISYKGRILAHKRWYDTDSRVFLWISWGLKKCLSHQQSWCERIGYGGGKCAHQPSGTDMMPSAGRHLVKAMLEGINVKYCEQHLWWIIVFVQIKQDVQWMRPSEIYKPIKKGGYCPQYFFLIPLALQPLIENYINGSIAHKQTKLWTQFVAV